MPGMVVTLVSYVVRLRGHHRAEVVMQSGASNLLRLGGIPRKRRGRQGGRSRGTLVVVAENNLVKKTLEVNKFKG